MTAFFPSDLPLRFDQKYQILHSVNATVLVKNCHLLVDLLLEYFGKQNAIVASSTFTPKALDIFDALENRREQLLVWK